MEIEWDWIRDMVLLLIGVIMGGFLAYLYGISISRRTLQNEAKYSAYKVMIPICKDLSTRLAIILKLSKYPKKADQQTIERYRDDIRKSIISIGNRKLLTDLDEISRITESHTLTSDDEVNTYLAEFTETVSVEMEIDIQLMLTQLDQHETILMLSRPSTNVKTSLKEFREKIVTTQRIQKLRMNAPEFTGGYNSLASLLLVAGISVVQFILTNHQVIDIRLNKLIVAMQEDLEDTLATWPWWARTKRWWRNRKSARKEK